MVDDLEAMIAENDEAYGKATSLRQIKIRVLNANFNRHDSSLNMATRRKNLKGGNSTFIELPGPLKKLKCLLNIKNNDQLCFVWSVSLILILDSCDFAPGGQEHEQGVKVQGVFSHAQSFLA